MQVLCGIFREMCENAFHLLILSTSAIHILLNMYIGAIQKRITQFVIFSFLSYVYIDMYIQFMSCYLLVSLSKITTYRKMYVYHTKVEINVEESGSPLTHPH